MREYEQEVREQYEIEIKSTRRTRGAFFCIGNADTEVFLMKETLASEKRAALLYLTLNRLEKTGKLKVDAPVFFKGWKADRCCQGRDPLYDEKVVLRAGM